MNLECKKDCWYLRQDKRPGRSPRIEKTGLVEMNAAIMAGLARELAKAVNAGNLKAVKRILHRAAVIGMAELTKRTGYEGCYVAAHPDSEGTLSFHFGLWPIDRENRCLIGISGGGKRGRRGLRTLGDAFTSVLRHHAAIGLPEELIRLPLWNVKQRRPDDWAVSRVMDKVVREELEQGPDGKQVVAAAEEYQREAARDWLARFNAGALGVEKMHMRLRKAEAKLHRRKVAAERLLAKARLLAEQSDVRSSELERENAELLTITAETRSFFEKVAAIPSLVAMLHGIGKEIWKIFIKITGILGIEVTEPKASPDLAAFQDQNDKLKFEVQSLIQGSVELIERADTAEAQLRVSDDEIQRLRMENKRFSERVMELKKGDVTDPEI